MVGPIIGSRVFVCVSAVQVAVLPEQTPGLRLLSDRW